MMKFMAIVVLLIFPFSAYADDPARDGGAGRSVKRGFGYLREGNYTEAENTFRGVLGSDPNNADAHLGLGACLYFLGNSEAGTVVNMVEEAVTELKEARRLGSRASYLHYVLGLSYLALGRKDDAQKEYGQLKQLDAGLSKKLLSAIRQYKSQPAYGKRAAKKVTVITPQAAGESGKFYPWIYSPHRIRVVKEKGKIVILEDGSLWEVSPTDLNKSALWRPEAHIRVVVNLGPFQYKLFNITNGENVEARFMRKE